MTCPISHARLVDYWSGELDDGELDAVEEHLLGCAACSEACARIAALAAGIESVLPPVVLERDLNRARARGMRTVDNHLRPGDSKEAWLPRDADVLVHRLGTDLTEAATVSIEFFTADGVSVLAFDDVPFDRSATAVVVACHRHFVELFPPDVKAVIRRTDTTGQQTVESYGIQHRVA